MNESIFWNEYAPPIKAKRKKYKVWQGLNQKWWEAVIIDTYDNEWWGSLRQQGTALSNDTTDFIINIPKIIRNNTIVEWGKVMLSIPDWTIVWWNMRGVNSIDLQVYRALNTQVASWDNSTTLWTKNSANWTYWTAIWYSNSAGLGNSTAIWDSNNAGWLTSTAIWYSNSAGWEASTAVWKSNSASNTSSTAVWNSNNVTQSYRTALWTSNNISGSSSVALWYSNTVSWHYSSALWVFCNSNTKLYSQSRWYYSRAENPWDEVVNISWTSTLPNVAKYVDNWYYIITANATPVEATLYNQWTTNRYVIPASKAVNFKLRGVAMDSAFNTKSWEITGTIKRNATNIISLVWTITKAVIWADTSTTSWDITVTADDTNEALSVFVTWDTTLATRFAIKLETVEVWF